MSELTTLRGRTSKVWSLGGDSFRLTTGPYCHAISEGMAEVDCTAYAEARRDSVTDKLYSYRNDPRKTDVTVLLGQTPGEVILTSKLTGKTLLLTPLDTALKAPEMVIDGRKLLNEGIWPGVDTTLVITDYGFKTAYLIKDGSGQRIIRYAVSGDTTDFKIGQASYMIGGKTFVVPTALSKGVLSMDFRNVPIGTIVDPTVGPVTSATSDAEIRHHPTSGTWAACVAAAAANEYVLASGDVLSLYNDWNAGQPYISRLFFPFDTTTLPANATVTSATAGFDSGAATTGPGTALARALLCYGTFDIPLALADYSKVGSAVSTTEWVPSAPSQTQDFAFTAAGMLTISKAGTTKLSIRQKADIDVAQPAGYAAISLLSANYAIAAQRPRLTVDYTLAAPSAPGGSGSNHYPFSGLNRGNQFRFR